MHPFRTLPKNYSANGWHLTPSPARQRPDYHTHILLFCMTIVTTVVAGMFIEDLNPLEHLSEFYRGLPYAGTLLAILFAHEMGHYLTARYYGMDVTLPYFLPAPPPIFFTGTIGAFIRMRSPAQHRRSLLYVAAAGPIAGFCVALPAAIYGYTHSTIVPTPTTAGDVYYLGTPLLEQIIRYFLLDPVPPGSLLRIHGVGMAAWVGLLVTMFNLMPMGQLDGGHIMYAIVGRHARYISRVVIGILLVMGYFFFIGWFLWAVMGWLTTLRQPLIVDPSTPLSRQSRIIAGLALIIFVLCFMPVPISLGPTGG